MSLGLAFKTTKIIFPNALIVWCYKIPLLSLYSKMHLEYFLLLVKLVLNFFLFCLTGMDNVKSLHWILWLYFFSFTLEPNYYTIINIVIILLLFMFRLIPGPEQGRYCGLTIRFDGCAADPKRSKRRETW